MKIILLVLSLSGCGYSFQTYPRYTCVDGKLFMNKDQAWQTENVYVPTGQQCIAVDRTTE